MGERRKRGGAEDGGSLINQSAMLMRLLDFSDLYQSS